MSDYFDRLEMELRAAVPRAVVATAPAAAGTAAPAWRRMKPSPGVVSAAIGIGATLLVAGLALLTLGHSHATPSSVGPASRNPAAPRTLVTPPGNQTAPRPARDILTARGIAGIQFGQPRAAVVRELDHLLGVPAGPYRPGRLCDVDHTITWRVMRSSGTEASLSGYFAHGRLVGYQYGDPGTQVVRRPPNHGPILATTRGLTIGDALARGRRLYGSAFKISAAQGGSWSVNTKSGRIDGYASDVPHPGNLNAVNVQTIAAGNVGCPALTP